MNNLNKNNTYSNNHIAVFPGTFDPITNGHLDIISRGSKIFDRVIVAVGINPDKTPLFSIDQRVEIINKIVSDIPNVEVMSYNTLTAEFATSINASTIIRGIRDCSDFTYESRAAAANRNITGIETVFLCTSSNVSHISSSLVRQIASRNGDISRLVPSEVLPFMP